MSNNRTTPRDLGNGLRLRWATAADADAVAEAASWIFKSDRTGEPSPGVFHTTMQKFSGTHPVVNATDWVLVEDTTAANKVVAFTNLQRQQWHYDGIPFAVGRPEYVGTDKEYRNRGLIRAIFNALHERSAERGELVQAITGIGYFYRQFGYEYLLDLEGTRHTPLAAIPAAPAAGEPYTLRPATLDDLAFIAALYAQRTADVRVATIIPEAGWHAVLTNTEEKHFPEWRLRIVQNAAGEPCGYVRTPVRLWGDQLTVLDLAAADGHELRLVAQSVLRGLRTVGEELAAKEADATFTTLQLQLGTEHPVYTALGPAVAQRRDRPYAWFVRVADLPAFLRQIAPVLERRLAASPMASYSGDLCLNFYKGGVKMVFERGKLLDAQPWQMPDQRGTWMGASFPPKVFWQLLFCYRSLDDLYVAYPDASVFDDTLEALLNALFPKGRSFVTAFD